MGGIGRSRREATKTGGPWCLHPSWSGVGRRCGHGHGPISWELWARPAQVDPAGACGRAEGRWGWTWGVQVEQRHRWAWEDGENSPQCFLVTPSAPVTAFSPRLCWDMEQLSPETHSESPKVTQQWCQSWGWTGPELLLTPLPPTPGLPAPAPSLRLSLSCGERLEEGGKSQFSSSPPLGNPQTGGREGAADSPLPGSQLGQLNKEVRQAWD